MIRAAIVGLGWWGRHLAGCLREPGSKLELARGVDPRAGELTDVVTRLDLPITTDLEDVLADARIDAVILATPHSQHESQILACAAAGKHVFCEKPLTLTAASARRVIAACEAAGVVLGVGHERRFEAAFVEIEKLVSAGALGTLMHLEANFSHDLLAELDPRDWRASETESPIPPLSAMAIHLTDAFLHLCGPVTEVFAYATKRVGNWGSGDVLSVQLKFASGLTGSLSTILVTPMFVRFQVFGSKAWVLARSDVHPGQPGITRLTLSRSDDGRTVRELDYVDSVRVNLDAFADAVAGRSSYPITNAEKLGNIAVMEAIVESAHSGRPASVAV